MSSLKSVLASAVLVGLSFSSTTFAKTKPVQLAPGEPAFCDLKTFQSLEILATEKGLIRNHTYQIGDLRLTGLAVGKSPVASTQALANQFSRFAAAEKSCTWYFNDGSDGAAEAFNHRYVSNPSFKGTSIANEFEKVLSSSFFQDPTSFMSCALDHGYIAMGCDGQKHRGPSVFAMVLAFAGCTPQNATAIANKIWGSNGVATATREAIANKGKLLGDANPALRKQFQAVMGVK